MTTVGTRSGNTPKATGPDFSAVKVFGGGEMRMLQYEVKAGDSLSKIARTLGTDVETLHAFNAQEIPNKNVIKVGQTLELPTTFYEVKPGDTYSKIAREFGMPYQTLMALNDAKNDRLQVGQELRVPALRSTSTETPRKALRALVEDMAKAEQTLYFGKGAVVTAHDLGPVIGYSGPYESGNGYEFANDLKSVKVLSHADEGRAATVKLEGPDDFRRLLVADVMTGLLHGRAAQLDAKHKDFKGEFKVLEGPTMGRNGTIQFRIDEPSCQDAVVVYDSKSGTLSVTPSATSETRTVKAGMNPSEVGAAMAKLLKIKLPLS